MDETGNSRPIDRDAIAPAPAGEPPVDGKAPKWAPESADAVPSYVLATERDESVDPDGREPSTALEATEAVEDDGQTRCIEGAGAMAPDGPSGNGLDATTDFDRTQRADSAAAFRCQGEWIGRYRIERRLGRGGFGEVFLAFDSELNRPVALKVPYASRVQNLEDFEDFVHEARILAGLDHGAIVPVYDIGRMDDGRCYIVSKFVDGSSLDRRLRDERPSTRVVAAWIATAAEALHFAHACGVIHRDVKPANILLDRAGRLYVADFGLARREGELEAERGFYGTPAYASPEQARREGHRIEVRSDVFSLGVVLYEALTGRNPFRRTTLEETLDAILESTPRPPRELVGSIAPELERICLKAMAKRGDDRYESAAAMAADLRHWLDEADGPAASTSHAGAPGPSLVPRGLRPYQGADSDAFLELIPGPRGRDGLPECLGFWKRRIEATDGTDPFPVGVIYGPTGSGKSSLVRAGLIPRLAASVWCVYVESTMEGTEARLLRDLRGRFPDLARHDGLASLLREIRQGRGPSESEKVLIVLDQFEQWLFGQRAGGRRELEDALRQCDGERVQALLLVRDDFWMDLTRFFRSLEVRLLDGWNAAAVDLFDLDHARRVLVALGRAHGRLPADPDALTPEHRAFLDRAVAALAQDDRIVCVRLVLLAELLRARPWTPATLDVLSGAEAIGVMMLDQAFSSPQAPPQNRVHRLAAQEVLKRLLPEEGVPIKGHMVSREALLEASGYSARPDEFQELMWILDHELRLVLGVVGDGWSVEGGVAGDERGVKGEDTGHDPTNGAGGADPSTLNPPPDTRHYQLTHDYLIPDLRDWLVRDRQRTLRGRAELRLQEFASLWSERHQDKFLPTAWEWAALRVLTDRSRWSAGHRAMMRAAAARHLRGAMAGAVLAAIIGLAACWAYGELAARSRVEGIKSADIGQVIRLTRDLGPLRPWAVPMLRREVEQGRGEAGEKLRCRIALLPDDPGQVDELLRRMLAEDPVTALVIREALWPRREAVTPRLWEAAKDARRPAPDRLRAAMALALYDPPDGRRPGHDRPDWGAIAGPIADELVTMLDANPAAYSRVLAAIAPIRVVLVPELKGLFVRRGDRRLQMATNLLIDLVRDDPDALAEIALEADDHQYLKLYPLLERHRMRVAPRLRDAAARSTGPGDERTAHHRAIAAIVLLRLGEGGDAWEIFRDEPDPRARTFVIHQADRYGLPLGTLTGRLESEDDPARIRGLLFAIGQHGALGTSAAEADASFVRSVIRGRLLGHGDAGVHGAAEWLLTRMGDNPPSPVDTPRDSGRRNWYVSREGYLMVILDARRVPGINRAFAIAARETTVEQFLRFDPSHWYNREVTADRTSPVNVVTWTRAIDYCEWLDGREGRPAAQSCYPRQGDRLAHPLVFPDLSRTGYRLPTRAEWEFACRAGTTTRRYYGDDDDDRLIHRYAWVYRDKLPTRMEPVGRLLPNDFGLFDVYGNVSEWNADIHPDGKQVGTSGGAYHSPPNEVSSVSGDWTLPDLHYNRYGFRVARTIELDEEGRPK